MNIWNSLIGSAKFHMNFHVWKCQISYEFPCLDVQIFISNCQISYEFLCLEVPNFIWIFLLWNSQFHMNIWNSLIGRAKFHMNFLVCKYPISDEQMKLPNLIWSSLIRSAQFHLKFPWISLIGSAEFYIDFPLWKYPIVYEHMTFIDWKCQIHWNWCNGLKIITFAP